MTSHFIGIIIHLYICLLEAVCNSDSDTVLGPDINIARESVQVQIGRKKFLIGECHVQGAAPLNITWMKSGKLIIENEKFTLVKIVTEQNTNTRQLWIREMALEDYGQYTCSATNLYGTKKKNVFVKRAVVRETRQESQSNCADKNYFNITVFLTCFAVIVHF
ncbi:neural cell adhesion molecule 2-like [Mytilus trossulus]|uniref:neural cell adhesion molecule 2-like n=1 Tax=Mytilus trossulus TaxID=6551 RepID=UPI0030052482